MIERLTWFPRRVVRMEGPLYCDRATPTRPSDVAFSPDGRLVAIGSWQSGLVLPNVSGVTPSTAYASQISIVALSPLGHQGHELNDDVAKSEVQSPKRWPTPR